MVIWRGLQPSVLAALLVAMAQKRAAKPQPLEARNGGGASTSHDEAANQPPR
jgi:hypothetical protein